MFVDVANDNGSADVTSVQMERDTSDSQPVCGQLVVVYVDVCFIDVSRGNWS